MANITIGNLNTPTNNSSSPSSSSSNGNNSNNNIMRGFAPVVIGVAGGTGAIEGPQEEREASVGGLTEEEIKARTPDDIPDLVSEDIVSRQLREAALSEEDPVLRERLWEEYRMYNDLGE